MNRNLKIVGVCAFCMYFWRYAGTYTDWHFIDYVNLIFHEAGHTIFFFLGQFGTVAAGSGFQVLLPLLISLYFFYSSQKLSGSLCLLWVGQNLLNVSVYAGDAVKMQLDLLGGDSVIHDWNYILSHLGLLKYTDGISAGIYWAGILVLLGGTFLSAYFVTKQEKIQTI